VRKLRKEKGLTQDGVAKKIGSHKGYVSGIENDKVNPPSIKVIKKYARLFGQDARTLPRLAWVDEARQFSGKIRRSFSSGSVLSTSPRIVLTTQAFPPLLPAPPPTLD
jgi:transcriptional regulator with XRE-family HTH domain